MSIELIFFYWLFKKIWIQSPIWGSVPNFSIETFWLNRILFSYSNITIDSKKKMIRFFWLEFKIWCWIIFTLGLTHTHTHTQVSQTSDEFSLMDSQRIFFFHYFRLIIVIFVVVVIVGRLSKRNFSGKNQLTNHHQHHENLNQNISDRLMLRRRK